MFEYSAFKSLCDLFGRNEYRSDHYNGWSLGSRLRRSATVSNGGFLTMSCLKASVDQLLLEWQFMPDD